MLPIMRIIRLSPGQCDSSDGIVVRAHDRADRGIAPMQHTKCVLRSSVFVKTIRIDPSAIRCREIDISPAGHCRD